MSFNSVNDVANTTQEMDRLRLNDGEFIDVHSQRNPPATAEILNILPSIQNIPRQISFYGWDSIHMSPNDLVAAGFYYTGIQDYVLCYVCGGGVKGWENGDRAWGEHARWYPDFRFVKQYQATPQASVEGLQRQLVEDKLVGQCVDVHLTNLREPPKAQLTRPLDHQHVKELENSFLRNPDQLVVMYGTVTGDVSMADLSNPGGAKVFVIGGNHTRVALQSLVSKGTLSLETIKMTVYRDLCQDEALFLGVQHNEVHNVSRPMTFMEKVMLIRDLGSANSLSNTNFHNRLKNIFGYETKTKVRYNLKNHLRLARVTDSIWQLVCQVSEAWQRGIISGQPKKKNIDQTFFIKLLREEEESQAEMLHILLTERYKEFLKKLSEKKECVVTDQEREEEGEQKETDQRHYEELIAENERLKEENHRLKLRSQQLENKIHRLECQLESQSNPKQTGTKRKADADDVLVFEEGAAVEALWRDKNPAVTGWYKATVKKCHDNGFSVEFEDTPGQEFKLHARYVRRQ